MFQKQPFEKCPLLLPGGLKNKNKSCFWKRFFCDQYANVTKNKKQNFAEISIFLSSPSPKRAWVTSLDM